MCREREASTRSKEQDGCGERRAKASRCRRESCFPAFWDIRFLLLLLHCRPVLCLCASLAGADRALLLFRCYEGDMCLHAELPPPSPTAPLHSENLLCFLFFTCAFSLLYPGPLSLRFLITRRSTGSQQLFVRCLLSPSCAGFVGVACLSFVLSVVRVFASLRVCSSLPFLVRYSAAASRRESVRRKEGLKTFPAPLPFICTCWGLCAAESLRED